MPDFKFAFTLTAIRRLLRWKPGEPVVEPAPKQLSYFLRPGMGGTTLVRPSAHQVLHAIFDGGDVRIQINDPEQRVFGVWTIDPNSCNFHNDGCSFTFCNGGRSLTVPVEGLGSCNPGAHAHTVFQIPLDGSEQEVSFLERGYRCFHSSERTLKDERTGEEKKYRRFIILVFPATPELPRVPKDP